MNNGLQLALYSGNSSAKNAEIRANAVFIYAKLVEAGVSIDKARKAVEKLFQDGREQGHLDKQF
jgi:hypothetical protein